MPGATSDWDRATGRRWDRLGERIGAQLAPWATRAVGRPETRFVLFAQGRTGSSLLRSLLNAHPEIHCADEVLGPRAVLFPVAHVERLARLTEAPVWGFKVKVYQLTRHQGLADPHAFLAALAERGHRIIHLRRRNLLRQAVSNAVAVGSGRYLHAEGDEPGVVTVNLDPAETIEVMRRRLAHAAAEDAALAGLEHLDVVYEDDLLDPARHQATADRVVGYLGREPQPVATRMRRSGSPHLSDQVENWDEVAAALAGTEFEAFVDDPAYG